MPKVGYLDNQRWCTTTSHCTTLILSTFSLFSLVWVFPVCQPIPSKHQFQEKRDVKNSSDYFRRRWAMPRPSSSLSAWMVENWITWMVENANCPLLNPWCKTGLGTLFNMLPNNTVITVVIVNMQAWCVAPFSCLFPLGETLYSSTMLYGSPGACQTLLACAG